jgi:hypothetical protein
MTKPGKLYVVQYVDGVKVMFNPRNNELIFILPSALYGKQLDDWKLRNAETLFNFVSTNANKN